MVFKTCMLGRGFQALIKMFLSPPQPMWDLTIHPLRGPVSSLALVPFSNRYGTPPIHPLRDPRPCWYTTLGPTPLPSAHNPPSSGLSVLASTRLLLQSMWVPPIHSPSGLSSLSTHGLMSIPFGAQPPYWHIARSLSLIPFVTSQTHY